MGHRPESTWDLPREEIIKGFRQGRLGSEVAYAIKYQLHHDFLKDYHKPWPLPLPDHGDISMRAMGNSMTVKYMGHFLEVLIIDDTVSPFPNHFLVVDKWNEIGILVVEGLEKVEEFKYGTILKVENPMVITIPGAEVGFWGHFYHTSAFHPNNVTVIGRMNDMCRYCLKENASRKCKMCKRQYCGRECQKADWKNQDHKVICTESPAT